MHKEEEISHLNRSEFLLCTAYCQKNLLCGYRNKPSGVGLRGPFSRVIAVGSPSTPGTGLSTHKFWQGGRHRAPSLPEEFLAVDSRWKEENQSVFSQGHRTKMIWETQMELCGSFFKKKNDNTKMCGRGGVAMGGTGRDVHMIKCVVPNYQRTNKIKKR